MRPSLLREVFPDTAALISFISLAILIFLGGQLLFQWMRRLRRGPYHAEVDELLATYIRETGQKLIWSGRPRAKGRLNPLRYTGFYVSFALAVLAAWLFTHYDYTGMTGPDDWLNYFTGLGILLALAAFGGIYVQAYFPHQAGLSHYAITDRQVIEVSGYLDPFIVTTDLSSNPSVRRRQNRDGTVTVWVEPKVVDAARPSLKKLLPPRRVAEGESVIHRIRPLGPRTLTLFHLEEGETVYALLKKKVQPI